MTSGASYFRLHGGAWIRGNVDWLTFMAPAVTALPAILVGVTYRLAPGDRWPAQYDDACAALRLVRQRIAAFGGDPARVVIGGHSAGGQLAAMAVLKGEAGPVLGCLPVSAPCDLRYGDVDPDSEAGRVYKYLLKQRSDDASASPILFVDGNRTPFHVLWGGHDFERIVDSSARFVSALRSAGTPVSERMVDGAGHFDTHRMLESAADPWYREAARMLGIG